MLKAGVIFQGSVVSSLSQEADADPMEAWEMCLDEISAGLKDSEGGLHCPAPLDGGAG